MSGLRMTEEEYQALLSANAGKKAPKASAKTPKPEVQPMTGVQRWQALGRLPEGELNGTEKEFADLLEAWKHDGKVLWWKAHPFNIRVAKGTYYRLDFLALMSDGVLTMFETKGGYTSEKGAMKIKLAAEALPVMRMVKATKRKKADGGGFELQEFNP
jgi:hypothetical protein